MAGVPDRNLDRVASGVLRIHLNRGYIDVSPVRNFKSLSRKPISFQHGGPLKGRYRGINYQYDHPADLENGIPFRRPLKAFIVFLIGCIAARYGWCNLNWGVFGPRNGLLLTGIGLVLVCIGCYLILSWQHDRIMDQRPNGLQFGNDSLRKAFGLVVH